jgi:hypothetical protein
METTSVSYNKMVFNKLNQKYFIDNFEEPIDIYKKPTSPRRNLHRKFDDILKSKKQKRSKGSSSIDLPPCPNFDPGNFFKF